MKVSHENCKVYNTLELYKRIIQVKPNLFLTRLIATIIMAIGKLVLN